MQRGKIQINKKFYPEVKAAFFILVLRVHPHLQRYESVRMAECIMTVYLMTV